MREELPPPVITITNPNSPGQLSDVIGDEPTRGPRRRLSWAERGLVALGVLVLGTTGAGAWGVLHLREQDRLDAQSVKEIDLLGDDGADRDSDLDTIGVGLLNRGPHPLTVLSAQLRDGTRVTARPNRLSPTASDYVTFRARPCPTTEQTYDNSRSPLVLTVRTYRGRTATVRVADPLAVSSFRGTVFVSTITTCRLYPPSASLVETAAIRPVRHGKDLLLTVPLRNRATLDRVLRSVSVNGGLELVSGPEDVPFPAGERLDVALTLRVADCTTARRSWVSGFTFSEDQTPDASGFSDSLSFGALTTRVSSAHASSTGIGLLLIAGTGQAGISPWVSAVCPG